MQAGGDRARPEGARRPRRQRSGRVRQDRRAGEGGPAELSSQREVFLQQAAHCDGRSSLYAELCRRLADEPLLAEIEPEARWDLPLRVLGGLHYLVLTGRARWDDVDSALVEHGDFLSRFVAEQSVQTNEVRRCWALLPAFLRLAERSGVDTFDLIELGTSAGFNLLWDRYRYRYERGEWGPADARLELAGDERRRIPGRLLRLQPTVRERVGIDLEPVDVTRAGDVLLLKSFVWADQQDRLERIDRAVEEVRARTPRILEGDYVELLPKLLAERQAGALTVVYQTASMVYLTREQRQEVFAALDAASREAPIGWISSAEPRAGVSGSGLEAGVWPGDRKLLAHMDFHGVWLEWLE